MRETEKSTRTRCACAVCCGHRFGIMFAWIHIFINKDGLTMIRLAAIICTDDGPGVSASISMTDQC